MTDFNASAAAEFEAAFNNSDPRVQAQTVRLLAAIYYRLSALEERLATIYYRLSALEERL